MRRCHTLAFTASLVLAAVSPAQSAPEQPFSVGNATGADDMPAVAYDSSLQRYFVVWTVPTTGAMADMYGRFFTTTGLRSAPRSSSTRPSTRTCDLPSPTCRVPTPS